MQFFFLCALLVTKLNLQRAQRTKLRSPKDLLQLEVGAHTSDLVILSVSFKNSFFFLSKHKACNTLHTFPHCVFLKYNPTVLEFNFQRQKPNLDSEAGY